VNKTHTVREHVHITGKQEERDAAYAYLKRHDYEVSYSGPRMVSFTRCDSSRFVIKASREVRKGSWKSTGIGRKRRKVPLCF